MAAGQDMTVPLWSPDGASIFLAFGDGRVDRVVRIDVANGELTHLLGLRPDTDPERALQLAAEGEVELADTAPPAEHEAHLARQIEIATDISTFYRVSVAADGKALFVAENGLQGDFIGHYQLDSKTYSRLVRGDVSRLVAHPQDATRVAVELRHPGKRNARDPRPDDSEIAVLSTSGEALDVTVNAQDEQLAGWARDGSAIYVQQASPQPRAKRFASRVYRLALP
jgi:hypothetical protein